MQAKAITRLDYCQYLLVSQNNYTLTHYAEHHPEEISHDRINRYLRDDKLTPKLVWEKVKQDILPDNEGILIFDDSILDKNHSHKIELVNHQYSGNAHRIIKGICIVNCIYVNPKTQQYWLIDYRIYDKNTDSKSKLDHLKDMLKHSIEHKQLQFKYVLMDTWYATKDIMLYNDNRTDWIVTNDTTQDSSDDTRLVCAIRWKIEQFHREIKQLTGIENNQCRKARIWRNHICCSMLVWVQLAKQAKRLKQTLYQVKYGLLSNYLREQLKSPSVVFA